MMRLNCAEVARTGQRHGCEVAGDVAIAMHTEARRLSVTHGLAGSAEL